MNTHLYKKTLVIFCGVKRKHFHITFCCALVLDISMFYCNIFTAIRTGQVILGLFLYIII